MLNRISTHNVGWKDIYVLAVSGFWVGGVHAFFLFFEKIQKSVTQNADFFGKFEFEIYFC